MGARSKLMCGTISCLILGLVLFVAGSSYVIVCECYPVAGKYKIPHMDAFVVWMEKHMVDK